MDSTAFVERRVRAGAMSQGTRWGPTSETPTVFYLAGAGTMPHLYERPSTAAAGHTVATFLVENLVEQMSLLRGQGVRFEEYDTARGARHPTSRPRATD